MMTHKIVAAVAVVTLSLAGCADGTGPNGSSQAVTLNVATSPVTASVAPESLVVGGHELVLSSVEIVLREIRLKRVGGDDLPCAGDGSGGDSDDAPAASASDGRGDDDDDDACEYFSTGPLLIDLPLGGAPTRVVTVDVDSGSYRRAEFRIHKPSGSEDAAFVAANPDFDRISVRATGTYDGVPFTFETDVSARQKISLDPPLEVGLAGPTDLTLMVDVKTWFVRNGVLVDPAQAARGKPAYGLVADNIRSSFRLFEDKDCDGREDD